MSRNHRYPLSALLLLAALGTACSSDECGPIERDDPDPFLPRTSAENLLLNLKQAYNDRELAEYDSLLADEFTFVYKPDESTIEEYLDVTQELGIHAHIFGTQYVQELSVDFEIGSPTVDAGQTAPGDTVWTVLMTGVHLMLLGTTPDHPTVTESLELIDATQQFWFKKTGWTDPSSGLPILALVRWEDLGSTAGESNSRGSAPLTWGGIKDMFK